MFSSYQMVLIDLDGTTLTEEKKITARTKKVLEHLDANGIPVVIATGRAIYTIRDLFRHMALRAPVIALNGAVIYEQVGGEVWEYAPIDDALLRDFIRISHTNPSIDNLLLEGIGHYYTQRYDHDIQESFVTYRHIPPKEVELIDYSDPITNLLVRPKGDKGKVHHWLNETYGDEIRFVKTEWHWLEGMRSHVHKGSAMKKVADRYRIPLSQVVAFGDEWNDIEMLESAGLSIAMENGSEAAKEAADLIAPANDKEGVAVMLEEIFADLLIETKYA